MIKNKTNKIITLIASIFLLAGCALPGLGGGFGTETIKIAGLGTTESQILSSMVQQLIEEETDYNVELISNLGTAVVGHHALLNGDADVLVPAYTGTDIVAIFGESASYDADETMEYLQERFANEFDQKYYDTMGFENTYAFMVTEELAQEKNLEKVSDLKDIAGDLRAGFDQTWLIREGDGYPAFQEAYEFSFGETYPMQIGLVYDAVASGDMDIVLGYSTDGRILSNNLVVLEDDLGFFPPYEGSVRATDEILESNPELDALFERLVGQIDTELMQQLNFEADDNLLEPSVVAQQFLEENNYFREEQP
ncbi:osmoprotectant ABC transporter substrate-binding protein [Ruoffia sp. FAM 20857]|uniref:osmoprotectant ABC transporter substrate-binding protein n=1 Tax=Ruoffia sp. FAM 20857 TaxID=3259515 RepID=UPI003888C0C4